MQKIYKNEEIHRYKCKSFPYEKLNYSKGDVKNHEQTIATIDQLEIALNSAPPKKKQ